MPATNAYDVIIEITASKDRKAFRITATTFAKAGIYATQQATALQAEVIKIEKIGVVDADAG